jgi:hypothetical protein
MLRVQVDALERDALQVLSLIRSTKNTFALINKMPLDVLTLVPHYWEDSNRDKNLIKLTHVCHSWRVVFTSHPSLWTRLDCTNIDKTRVYIERSRSFPLEVSLDGVYSAPYSETLPLVLPHINRLEALSVSGCSSHLLPVLIDHFSCPLPLLRKLNIHIECEELPFLADELFNGDLSLLQELSLKGALSPLPWRDMSSLVTFSLHDIPEDRILSSQLLDFFESAPHIRHIKLYNSIPGSCDVPAGRVVSLAHLKDLSITAQPPHSILLNHLSIPTGASLSLEFSFSGRRSPISSYLPKSCDILHNISHITSVNLGFGSRQRSIRLYGPSGELYVHGGWIRGNDKANTGTSLFLQSLSQFNLSKCQRLAIRWCHSKPPSSDPIVRWAVYRTLIVMESLRTVILVHCSNLPFIHSLDPDKNPSATVLCPNLERMTLYVQGPDQLHTDDLVTMAEERARKGAKLAMITIVCTGVLAPPKDVFQLRKHVTRVECKFDDIVPAWDALPAKLV